MLRYVIVTDGWWLRLTVFMETVTRIIKTFGWAEWTDKLTFLKFWCFDVCRWGWVTTTTQTQMTRSSTRSRHSRCYEVQIKWGHYLLFVRSTKLSSIQSMTLPQPTMTWPCSSWKTKLISRSLMGQLLQSAFQSHWDPTLGKRLKWRHAWPRRYI